MDSATRFGAHDLRFSPRAGLTHEVAFALAAGQALQVTGPSGIGKTTLLRVLARLHAPESGTMALGGQAAAMVQSQIWRRQVAYVTQRPVMIPGTVGENLAAPFATRATKDRFDRANAEALLSNIGLDPAQVWQQEAKLLSGGEAARVALCRALLMQPKVLLVDEPTAALDEKMAGRVVACLGDWVKDGGALILVAHDGRLWESLVSKRLALTGGPS